MTNVATVYFEDRKRNNSGEELNEGIWGVTKRLEKLKKCKQCKSTHRPKPTQNRKPMCDKARTKRLRAASEGLFHDESGTGTLQGKGIF